ncbi:hypothetical protein NDU88_002734 [Pleurodeles waltl]|uniref:Uncharacterized protein n=1 Tax=Pleurodeles waltl TaxID=8319 RepID=A0AAV7VEN4_PLEWA|nr:hypothetical protein NDU88_002734 [Pleurodeles waltl]
MRCDTLTTRLDHMNERIDHHMTRLDGTEHRISEVEDEKAEVLKHLEKIESLLKAAVAKNEDLTSRCRHYNIRIIGIAESTKTGHMDVFMEKLLVDLFGWEAFIDTFIVERAHSSFRPHLISGAPPHPLPGFSKTFF